MPTIDPSLIPTKAPGTIFSALTGGDQTLAIRWLTGLDPVFFEAINRPMSDITVRQLVLAKAIDNLQVRLGHQVNYPYLVQPRVASGTTEVDVPLNWIWDFQAALPKKWENLRLAKIKRIAGTNDNVTDGFDGTLRLIFTANVQNSATEVAIFYADYQIDSPLTFQLMRLNVVDSTEENVPISASEAETVAGFIAFQTLDTTESAVQDFLELLVAATTTDADSNGIFDTPTVYEIVDSPAGGVGVDDDFSLTAMSHGTGLLTDSTWAAIPPLDSDIQSWLSSFNYPFDADANRRSIDNITIPLALFREFNIAAPAGDQPTGDVSGTFYPVWISRIQRVDDTSTQLRLYFSTYNVTDADAGGSPSTDAIEFATLDLLRNSSVGDVVEITPNDNLKLEESTLFGQHFGRGHVVLSSLWGNTGGEIDDFFDQFDSLVTTPADTTFSQAATRISAFGISRVPKYIPTIGQSRALLGSTSRLDTPIEPSYDNRYVTEQDQGLGNTVDLEAEDGITPVTAIDRYGYTGALTHRIIRMNVDASSVGTDPAFYDTNILPRLRILLGRDPQFGDFWHNGTRLLFFNGDTWQSAS